MKVGVTYICCSKREAHYGQRIATLNYFEKNVNKKYVAYEFSRIHAVRYIGGMLRMFPDCEAKIVPLATAQKVCEEMEAADKAKHEKLQAKAPT